MAYSYLEPGFLQNAIIPVAYEEMQMYVAAMEAGISPMRLLVEITLNRIRHQSAARFAIYSSSSSTWPTAATNHTNSTRAADDYFYDGNAFFNPSENMPSMHDHFDNLSQFTPAMHTFNPAGHYHSGLADYCRRAILNIETWNQENQVTENNGDATENNDEGYELEPSILRGIIELLEDVVESVASESTTPENTPPETTHSEPTFSESVLQLTTGTNNTNFLDRNYIPSDRPKAPNRVTVSRFFENGKRKW